jgi:diguanylate cyclase (GGDEF)-like protein
MEDSLQAKLLIVDDEVINIEILASGLSQDYQVQRCTNSLQVEELAQVGQPDLILLDIGMPDMDGYQVCKALKENDQTRHIPIIFSTAFDSDDDQIKGLQYGGADYITKPFNMQLIKLRVRNLLLLNQKTDLLEQLVNLDGLTNIPNRRHFDETYDVEWRRALRQHSTISICMLDIDFFKQFNDLYGHAAGDKCLIRVAKVLRAACLRGGEFVARYGGEEFVAILPDIDIEEAMGVAERIRNKVESLGIKHQDSACSDVVTLSVGVASAVLEGKITKERLLKEADDALYLAKSSGRNKVSSISP